MGIFNFLKNPEERFASQNKKNLELIGKLGEDFLKLSDFGLREKSLELKEQIKKGVDLENFLIPAFALIREAATRTLKQRHFDSQLLGGIALHQGRVAEMKTGEGKTLAATAPAYLNALTGRGVHIVTVNDYLAKRDAVWMGQIYYALGITVGCIAHDSAFIYDPEQAKIKTDSEGKDERDVSGGFKIFENYLKPVSRKEAYNADIVYGTNHEFGFDYLRDNLVYDKSDRVQRERFFAIVDEVDSILIDEARTPLIITVPETESSEYYKLFSKIVPSLESGIDYEIDEKMKAVSLTEQGISKVENRLQLKNLYNQEGFRFLHYLEESLKAWTLFKKDKDYVVKNGEVIIVDEFTGRMLFGRRYSGGLHQAIEAKEGVFVNQENRILASITFQNYFRTYEKLAGMTGTALTSSEELDKVYGLTVTPIPTNKPMARKDFPDLIFKTEKEKWDAIIKEIKNKYESGQPILIGTISIEKNEKLSALLDREGIEHQVLNAKNHEKEGAIIAQAGKLKAVTVATNMAGRGVDIILGGNPPDEKEAEAVKKSGGLHIIGTERHDARRIDNQLRGRAGRQGDPGSSQFFVSLEDDLMRIFGGERLKGMMEKINYPEGEPLESKLISKAIESAQNKVEGMNFDARKHTLEYDDVLNKHRSAFYKKRDEIFELLENGELERVCFNYFKNPIERLCTFPKEEIQKISENLGLIEIGEKISEINDEDLFNFIWQKSEIVFAKTKEKIGSDLFAITVKTLILRIYDVLWTEHLENMEYLRESVRIRAYGQHDPLIEYKSGSRDLFQNFFNKFENIFFESFFNLEKPAIEITENKDKKLPMTKEPGRNDPCPCGSGKKYKRCHGNA